jgi:hypothetical protein
MFMSRREKIALQGSQDFDGSYCLQILLGSNELVKRIDPLLRDKVF